MYSFTANEIDGMGTPTRGSVTARDLLEEYERHRGYVKNVKFYRGEVEISEAELRAIARSER